MIIIPSVVSLKLSRKVLKGIEAVGSVKPFIVLSVAPFHLPVVPWRVWPDQLMSDAILLQTHLEKGRLVSVGSETVSKFRSVICLDALNPAGEGLNKMIHKQSR